MKKLSPFCNLLRTKTLRWHQTMSTTISPKKRTFSETSNSEDNNNTTTSNTQHFEQQYAQILQMRSARDAPVDKMGCAELHQSDATPAVQRFQTLVSLMLSSQTKDEITAAAMEKLKKHGLTIQNMQSTPAETIAQLIYPVGFYKVCGISATIYKFWQRKSEYIKKTADMLANSYNFDIPNNVKELCKLPGVGM